MASQGIVRSIWLRRGRSPCLFRYMEPFDHKEFRLLSDAELKALPEHQQMRYVRHSIAAMTYLNEQISRLLGYSGSEPSE